MDEGTLYYRYRDPHDGMELCDAYDITWIYYCPYQITIETVSGQLFLSRLAKNYVGLTCRSPDNEYTHPIQMKWKKFIKFLINQ